MKQQPDRLGKKFIKLANAFLLSRLWETLEPDRPIRIRLSDGQQAFLFLIHDPGESMGFLAFVGDDALEDVKLVLQGWDGGATVSVCVSFIFERWSSLAEPLQRMLQGWGYSPKRGGIAPTLTVGSPATGPRLPGRTQMRWTNEMLEMVLAAHSEGVRVPDPEEFPEGDEEDLVLDLSWEGEGKHARIHQGFTVLPGVTLAMEEDEGDLDSVFEGVEGFDGSASIPDFLEWIKELPETPFHWGMALIPQEAYRGPDAANGDGPGRGLLFLFIREADGPRVLAIHPTEIANPETVLGYLLYSMEDGPEDPPEGWEPGRPKTITMVGNHHEVLNGWLRSAGVQVEVEVEEEGPMASAMLELWDALGKAFKQGTRPSAD